MAPRANWKGFLRLSLVTCPVALYPATSDSEKISFNQINRNTGHRIKYTRWTPIPARRSPPKTS
jgi:DNA end-binding protein Ku